MNSDSHWEGHGDAVMDKYLDGLDPTKKMDWNDPASNVETVRERKSAVK